MTDTTYCVQQRRHAISDSESGLNRVLPLSVPNVSFITPMCHLFIYYVWTCVHCTPSRPEQVGPRFRVVWPSIAHHYTVSLTSDPNISLLD